MPAACMHGILIAEMCITLQKDNDKATLLTTQCVCCAVSLVNAKELASRSRTAGLERAQCCICNFRQLQQLHELVEGQDSVAETGMQLQNAYIVIS